LRRFITLTTDFGQKDSYVGQMKGVIFGINPECEIVDITHEIEPQDLMMGAFCLLTAYKFFPKGTIHVAVVDPGVGGKRRPIVVETPDYFFVGPDNGIFTFIYRRERSIVVREIKNRSFFNEPVSTTFHGRDIFGPVAAHLSLGVKAENIGPEIENLTLLSIPEPSLKGEFMIGEVIYFDRFGNAITNLTDSFIHSILNKRRHRIMAGDVDFGPIQRSYDSVDEGMPICLIGSCGFLELSVRNGSARDLFSLKKGDPVFLRWGD
jgi:S-adenosylmethionine hydrolase